MQITIEVTEQELTAHNNMIELAAKQAIAIHQALAEKMPTGATVEYALQLLFLQCISGAGATHAIVKIAATLGAGFILVHRNVIIKKAQEMTAAGQG